MATTLNLIRPRQGARTDARLRPHRALPQDAAWWREEIGIEVEHEIWHLPQLAEEEQQAQA